MTENAGGIDTSGAFGDGRAYLSSTPSQAAPTAAPGQTPNSAPAQAPVTRDAAIAERASLMKSKAFAAQYANPDPTVSEAARAKMESLNKLIDGEQPLQQPGSQSQQAQPQLQDGAPAEKLPFLFTPADSLEYQAQVQRDGADAAKLMGAPPDMATSFVQTLRDAQLARAVPNPDGKGLTVRPMDAAEKATMKADLQRFWGDAYRQKAEDALYAIDAAGKHSAWLQRAIFSSGAKVAALAFAQLADQGARLRASRGG